MKRVLFLVLAIILFSTANNVKAQQFNNADDFLNRLKTHRNAIYSELDLTQEQLKKIKELDTKLYIDLRPEFETVSLKIKTIQDIANSNNCSKKRIDNVKKEFESTDKNITVIKNNYEKEFKTIITPEQSKKYKQIRKQKQQELKQEIKEINRKNRLNTTKIK